MRTVCLYVSCLLLPILTGMASCELHPYDDDRPPPDPVIFNTGNPCIDTGTKSVDTIYNEVQLYAPFIDTIWSGVVWGEALRMPQLTKDNATCLQVFVSQGASGLWYDVPLRGARPLEVNYKPFPDNLEKHIELVAHDKQTQLPAIDFSKKIAVKIRYKTY